MVFLKNVFKNNSIITRQSCTTCGCSSCSSQISKKTSASSGQSVSQTKNGFCGSKG